jgi:CrcB protein
MERVLLVCLGSALGGGLRYVVSLMALRWLGPGFPFGTLIVNVTGSFLIGAIMHVALTSAAISPLVRLFLTTGIMGGLTTYSTFNYETLEFLRNGSPGIGSINVVVTILTCLGAGVLGLAAGRLLVAGSNVAG